MELDAAEVLAIVALIAALAAIALGVINRAAIQKLEARLDARRSAEEPTQPKRADAPATPARQPLEPPFEPPPGPPPIPAAMPRTPLRPPLREPSVEVRAARAPRRPLEERLGASLPIWFGAVALALAAIFLVKHVAERGLLGPAARVAIATAFGLGLLGLALPLRRRRPAIAQGVAASGVAALSAATYAATALYAFLPPFPGVLAQGLVTAIAIVASLHFGPFVALLGLLGGFVIPGLVGPGELGAPQMFGYLVVLQLGVAIVAGRRGWWALPLLSAVGAFAWAFGWQALRDDGASILSPFVLVAAATAIIALRRGTAEPAAERWDFLAVLPHAVIAAALIAVIGNVDATIASAEHRIWAGLLAAGTLLLAARDRDAAGLPWLAAIFLGYPLLSPTWPTPRAADGSPLPLHLGTLVGYALIFGFGPHLAASRPRAARAALAWLTPAAVLTAILAAVGDEIDVAAPAVIAAVVASAAAIALRARGDSEARGERESALWTTVCITLGAAILDGVRPGMRVPLLALLPIGVAALCWRLALRRLAAVALAAGLALVFVSLRFLLTADRTAGPALWNARFAAAVATAASAWITSRLLDRAQPGTRGARFQQGAAVGLSAVVIAVAVDQVIGQLDIPRPAFVEIAWITTLWLVLGQGLYHTAARWAIGGRAGSHLTTLALVVLMAFCGLLLNPLWVPVSVGELPIVNALLLAFGAGGALALLARQGWLARGAGHRAAFAGGIAFCCGLLLVTLELRHLFHGEMMHRALPGRGEWYGYSAVWLAYGAVLLAIGVVRDQRVLRQASLLVVLLAVTKVFVFDASHLDGLWRVLSFFGLGVALITLAWVYQRFVAGRAPDTRPAPDAEPSVAD